MPEPVSQRVVDALGLMCPEPVLRARRALDEMAGGEVVEVQASDPHAELDFEVFCARTGHELLQQSTADGVYRFWIRRRTDHSA